MKDLLLALDSILDQLNRSLIGLSKLRSIRDTVSEDLRPIIQGAPEGGNMFLLAGNLDSLKCLIDAEIEEVHHLLVSCEKAKELATKEAYEHSLAQRLQELAHVDAAVQDGKFSRYVPGLAPLGLSFEKKSILADAEIGAEENWRHWATVLEEHTFTLRHIALQFPSTHPFSPPFGMIINMLNSTFQWCEEQRKLHIAIEVLSKPNAEIGRDYGSFLRLELLELRRQVSALPRGEEE